jgi:N-acetyl-gamma-glutamyl-phosphate reductase
MRTAVVGGSGYLGAELLRLLAGHPDMEVALVQASGAAGTKLKERYPGLEAQFGELVYEPIDPGACEGCDVVFVAVPSGASQELVAALVDKVACVVDLGADFRLKDAAAYERWYGFEHRFPQLLDRAVYGLPELDRSALPGARLVAAPGCYVTAASLALAPLVREGLVERKGIVVDAASGTSGAGRSLSDATHHAAVNEGFSAYKVLEHRHTPEIEQAIGATVVFTPHLAPMTRGILATCYAQAVAPTSTEEVLDVLAKVYEGEPFVVVDEALPSTRACYGTNLCRLSARHDSRTGAVVVLSAIDNLTKGGSGQAIQAANAALGLPEETGLPRLAVGP